MEQIHNEYTAAYSSASGSVDEEFTILLDGTRISSINFYSFDVTDVINEKERTAEITFEYNALPEFPEDLEVEFEEAAQHSVKVIWGESLGESLLYTDYQPNGIGYIGLYGDYGLTPEALQKYTPENPGKKAEYYFDAAFSDPVVSGKPIYVYDDDTVIYVKWSAM